MWIIIALLFCAITIVGDYFLKKASESQNFADWRFFIPALLIYIGLTFAWVVAMKHMKLSNIAIIYGVGTMLFLVLLSVTVFHERLNSYEITGLLFAVISIVLLARFS